MPPRSTPASGRVQVVILGNDALVAARPATPVQLARASLAFGYSFVAPGSWGDELLAERAIGYLSSAQSGAMLLLHCPFVRSIAAVADNAELPRCSSVSPPQATARYLRAAFVPQDLHVTYVGRCPGAMTAEIDEHMAPEAFLARLSSGGCPPLREPDHFTDIIPPDRRRFASQPGGAPSPTQLAAMAAATFRDVAPETLSTVAHACEPDERCLLDLAQAAGCWCARDAVALQRLEPPRSPTSVIDHAVHVDLDMPSELRGPLPWPVLPDVASAAPATPSVVARPSTLSETSDYWVGVEGDDAIERPRSPDERPHDNDLPEAVSSPTVIDAPAHPAHRETVVVVLEASAPLDVAVGPGAPAEPHEPADVRGPTEQPSDAVDVPPPRRRSPFAAWWPSSALDRGHADGAGESNGHRSVDH